MVRSAALVAASVVGLAQGLAYVEPSLEVKGECVDPRTGAMPQICKHAIAALKSVSNVESMKEVMAFKKECEEYGLLIEAEEAAKREEEEKGAEELVAVGDKSESGPLAAKISEALKGPAEETTTEEEEPKFECELALSLRLYLFGMRERCLLFAGWEIPEELREYGFVTPNHIYTNLNLEQPQFSPRADGGHLLKHAFYKPWKPYNELTAEERAKTQDHCEDTNYESKEDYIIYKSDDTDDKATFTDYLAGTMVMDKYEVIDAETMAPMPYRKNSGLWGNFVFFNAVDGWNIINGTPTGATRTYIAVDLHPYDPTLDDSVTSTSTEPATTELTETTTEETTTEEPIHDDNGKGKGAPATLALTAGALAAAAFAIHY